LLTEPLEHFSAQRETFMRYGFGADARHEEYLISSLPCRACQSELGAGDYRKLELADLVRPYINRTIQFLPGWPTPRARYFYCLSRKIQQEHSDKFDALISTDWLNFAREANMRMFDEMDGITRSEIVDFCLQNSASKSGFSSYKVEKKSLQKWHRRPSWIDAAIGLSRGSGLDVMMTCETSRPKKHKFYPGYKDEPSEMSVNFDTIELALWVVPTRAYGEFESVAFEIRSPFTRNYRNFFSLRGLQHIIEAHIVSARLMIPTDLNF
jgi:hypothetical protein